MSLTANKFKRTEICGDFINSDYPDASILASANFHRDVTIGGNIICTSLSNVFDTKANLTYVNDELDLKANITYVDDQITDNNSNLFASNNIWTGTQTIDSNYLEITGDALSTFMPRGSAKTGGLMRTSNNPTALSFINSNSNLSTVQPCFIWEKMINTDDKIEYMRLSNTGNLVLYGTITSPTINTLNDNINLKANTTTVNNALALKADTSAMNTELTLKANITDMNTALALKANITDMNTALALKANTTDMNTALALKANTTDVNTALDLKVNETGGTLTNGIINRLYFYGNQAQNSITYPEDTYSCVGNDFDGDRDLYVISDAYGYPNTKMCSWYTHNLSNDKIYLMSLTRAGNLDIVGNITSPTITTINTNIGLKANTTTVNSALALKADTSTVNSALSLKADTSTVNSALALKADTTTVNSALALKADTTTVNSALALKADTSTVNSALDLKANITYVDTQISSVTGSSGLASKADLTYVNDQLALKSNINNPTFTGTVSGITKSMVGLGNVDNTTDANKPVSTAQQTALDLKLNRVEGSLTNCLTSANSFFRFTNAGSGPLPNIFGSQQFMAIGTNRTGGQADGCFIHNGNGIANNTHRAFTFMIMNSSTTSNELMTIRKGGDMDVVGNITSPTITTINNNIALKADTTYVDTQIASVSGASGLASKADLTYVNDQLALKSNINNPTFTGTVSGITKSMVGLANVDNTTDANKPVSTAQQTALDLKLNRTSGTLTGGIASRLYLSNTGNANFNPYPTNTFGAIGANMSNGFGDISLVSSSFGFPNSRSCGWYTNINSTDSTINYLMGLSRSGNLDVVGNITSPTITTINNNIALKANTTDMNTSLNLKLNIASPRVSGFMGFGTGAFGNLPVGNFGQSPAVFGSVGCNEHGTADVNFYEHGGNDTLTQIAFSFKRMLTETTTRQLMTIRKSGNVEALADFVTTNGVVSARNARYNCINVNGGESTFSFETLPATIHVQNTATVKLFPVINGTHPIGTCTRIYITKPNAICTVTLSSSETQGIILNGVFTGITSFSFTGVGYVDMMIVSSNHIASGSTIRWSASPPVLQRFGTDIATNASNIALKANINNPTFTGIVKCDTLEATSDILSINASNYISMQSGNVLIEDNGDILSRSYSDNTGNNRIESTGITCSNLNCASTIDATIINANTVNVTMLSTPNLFVNGDAFLYGTNSSNLRRSSMTVLNATTTYTWSTIKEVIVVNTTAFNIVLPNPASYPNPAPYATGSEGIYVKVFLYTGSTTITVTGGGTIRFNNSNNSSHVFTTSGATRTYMVFNNQWCMLEDK